MWHQDALAFNKEFLYWLNLAADEDDLEDRKKDICEAIRIISAYNKSILWHNVHDISSLVQKWIRQFRKYTYIPDIANLQPAFHAPNNISNAPLCDLPYGGLLLKKYHYYQGMAHATLCIEIDGEVVDLSNELCNYIRFFNGTHTSHIAASTIRSNFPKFVYDATNYVMSYVVYSKLLVSDNNDSILATQHTSAAGYSDFDNVDVEGVTPVSTETNLPIRVRHVLDKLYHVYIDILGCELYTRKMIDLMIDKQIVPTKQCLLVNDIPYLNPNQKNIVFNILNIKPIPLHLRTGHNEIHLAMKDKLVLLDNIDDIIDFNVSIGNIPNIETKLDLLGDRYGVLTYHGEDLDEFMRFIKLIKSHNKRNVFHSLCINDALMAHPYCDTFIRNSRIFYVSISSDVYLLFATINKIKNLLRYTKLEPLIIVNPTCLDGMDAVLGMAKELNLLVNASIYDRAIDLYKLLKMVQKNNNRLALCANGLEYEMNKLVKSVNSIIPDKNLLFSLEEFKDMIVGLSL